MRQILLRWLCALLAAPMLAATPACSAEILWRLDNPFRLFTEAGSTQVHREVFEQLTEAEKLEPILSAERRLMQKFPFGWARESFSTTCWDRDNAVYGPCGNDDGYVNPKSHRVLVQVDHPELIDGDCDWSVASEIGADDTEEQHVHVGCGGAVALDIPYPTGARVRVSANGLSVGETVIKVDDILVVAIGDSFGSGEGNPDQAVEFSRDRTIDYGKAPGGVELTGYPARIGAWASIGDKVFLEGGPRWLSTACHRSLYAYSTRTALQLALDNPHRAVTYANFACAGAEIVYGLMISYKGPEWAKDQPDKPQVSAVARLQCGATMPTETNYQNTYSLNGVMPELDNIVLATCPREATRRIDLLMVSVGGNDVGFARVVANAILADKGLLRRLGGWMGEVEEAEGISALLPTLEKRFQALNRALHGHLQIPWDQSDRILLTAYPVMAIEENGSDVCPEGQSGMTVFPEFVLNRNKARDNEVASEQLNRTMRKVAKTYGWTYVEQHRAEFAGHGVCAGTDEGAINFSDDSRMPRMVDGAWTPYNPAEFRPYVPRRRWFRTPNDAFLTGNYHISSTILKSVMNLQSIEWFQLVLASTYSGAFHPSSEGQAVIADAVLEKARSVLDKYARKRAKAAAEMAGRGR